MRLTILQTFPLLAMVHLASNAMGATHADWIGQWDAGSSERGRQLYETVCLSCHGTPEALGSLPTSRQFWKEPFKNGADPVSLYRTIREGFGQMPAWPGLPNQAIYDVIHYVREEFLKQRNPAAYFQLTAEYLAGLPAADLVEPDAAADATPHYLRMNFGPSLNYTYEASPGNIAYKGIAVRLDPGPGGVSKGRAWMLYEHDTMRVAAAWTGEGFIDWKNIAFDGSHGTHVKIAGDRTFENPAGPGWANPKDGSWDDPRLRGRDGKPYGPLPRDWARFKGIYRHENKLILSYTVGTAEVLELPEWKVEGGSNCFSRVLNVGPRQHELVLRAAPLGSKVTVLGEEAKLDRGDGSWLVRIPAGAAPARLRITVGGDASGPVPDLAALTRGGPAQWDFPMVSHSETGSDEGAFAVDTIALPMPEQNPWQSWMRLGGLDFFEDGKRAAVCTWLGEVWLASGIESERVTWKRIAAGLFQPLGLKIVDGVIHVTCRDQIVRLHDLNGDEEIDYYENFNSDHQVTEHFHEFAMGLQTDQAGNFYYAKSARHALPALVPHHGTLLRVTKDGSRTAIVANGFRAANGVCVNDDGTFFVTDQEGHWTPKNRINLVKPGGFYGNFMGYHDRTSSADSDMEQPLVWITNEIDRSPGEVVRVRSDRWGPLNGALLNLSYGTGKIYLVPHEQVGEQMQGGVVPLPIPDLPTGVMRGRFHPATGDLYACGLFAWAGNRTADGGFYRIRRTGRAMHLPMEVRARTGALELRFTDPLERASAERSENYALKIWGLKRTADYGSKHHNEMPLKIDNATLSDDGRTVRLAVPELRPTWCMETKYTLRGTKGEEVSQRLHHTIHKLAP